jgi:hypothetical protein
MFVNAERARETEPVPAGQFCWIIYIRNGIFYLFTAVVLSGAVIVPARGMFFWFYTAQGNTAQLIKLAYKTRAFYKKAV